MNAMSKFLKTYFDWIFCIIISFFVGIISFIWNIPSGQHDEILYLLSAISQSLATIFALVFTISLMFSTVSKNASIDKIINQRAKILMLIFAIGIILPILILKIAVGNAPFINNSQYKDILYDVPWYNLFVSITIGLASFCVISIFPYLKSCNHVFKFEFMVNDLIDALYKSMGEKNYLDSVSIMFKLLDLSQGAIQANIEKPLDQIERTMVYFITDSIPKQVAKSDKYGSFIIIDIFRRFALSSTDASMDKIASGAADKFTILAKVIIGENIRDNSLALIIKTLCDVGMTAVNQNLEYVQKSSLRSLFEIYKITSSNKDYMSDSENAITNFWTVSAYLIKKYPDKESIIVGIIKDMNLNDSLSKINIVYMQREHPVAVEYLERFINKHKRP